MPPRPYHAPFSSLFPKLVVYDFSLDENLIQDRFQADQRLIPIDELCLGPLGFSLGGRSCSQGTVRFVIDARHQLEIGCGITRCAHDLPEDLAD